MFGNKYSADELAKNFQRRVETLKKISAENSSAIKKEAKKVTAEVDASSFLIDSSSETANAGDALESHIKDMASDDKCSKCGMAHDGSSCAKDGKADDTACSKCSYVHDASDGCVSKVEDKKAYIYQELTKVAKRLNKKGALEAAKLVSKTAKEFNQKVAKKSEPKVDFEYLVDKKAQYILQELGKIASDLQREGNGFAADMVEVTALEIKDEVVKKAASKVEVIETLKKMAKEAYVDGDNMTGDVIQATILSIKKS